MRLPGMATSFPVTPEDEYNRKLVSQVCPSDWQNPKPASRYNLVVLGAGAAGLVSAAGAAGLGARVALVEREFLGGDCLNVGCVPSKAILRAARAVADVRDASDYGVREAGAQVDFARVMERMRRLRASISPNDSAHRFQQLGVDIFFGQARFLGPKTVDVNGSQLHFRRCIIAAGARAARPNIPGLSDGQYHTNESIFALTELPRRLAVVGAGPVGCELAQAFARLGAKVTLITDGPRILPREDADAAAIIERALSRDGALIHLGSSIERVSSEGPDRLLTIGTQQIPADAILVAVGRTTNVEGLDLEAANVAYDRQKGVHVDDFLRTSNPAIYAAGDICSRYKFTHAADAMARLAIRNALFLGRDRVSALTIPHCTYTDPELAHVGLTAQQADEQRISIRSFTIALSEVDRAILDGETEGFVRIHVKAKTDRIVGATIVARHAGEMISEITLAMSNRIGLSRLSKTIHPYPTQAEAIRKAADAYQRSRLTPWIKSLFQRWLTWTR